MTKKINRSTFTFIYFSFSGLNFISYGGIHQEQLEVEDYRVKELREIHMYI